MVGELGTSHAYVTASSVFGAQSRVRGEQAALLGADVSRAADGRWLVGVGSDHTDRALESQSIAKAKLSCDKPVSATFWDLRDVREHWDQLVLTAWAGAPGAEATYQSAHLADLMTPEAIREELAARVPDSDDAAIFSGTLPVIGGEFNYGSCFRAELSDPVLGRSLRCSYRVSVLPELD